MGRTSRDDQSSISSLDTGNTTFVVMSREPCENFEPTSTAKRFPFSSGSTKVHFPEFIRAFAPATATDSQVDLVLPGSRWKCFLRHGSAVFLQHAESSDTADADLSIDTLAALHPDDFTEDLFRVRIASPSHRAT